MTEEKSSDCNVPNDIVCKKWQAVEQIGRGTFGRIFKGINVENKKTVAMKYIIIHNRKHLKLVGNEIRCLREI